MYSIYLWLLVIFFMLQVIFPQSLLEPFSFFHNLLLCGWDTLWHLQEFLQCIKYIMLKFTILLYLPSPHSLNSFNRYHFSTYIYVDTVFAPYLPSPWYHFPKQDLFQVNIIWLCKKKQKMTVCLFKIATEGVSLWHFHIYVQYSLLSSISFSMKSSLFLFFLP
jgi:hypothetical protein